MKPFSLESFAAQPMPPPTAPRSPSALRRLPKHEAGEKFLMGPIPWNWVVRAMQAGGRAWAVGTFAWHQAFMKKTAEVTLPTAELRAAGISKDAALRGAVALAEAGLVELTRRRGRKLRLRLLPVVKTALLSEVQK